MGYAVDYVPTWERKRRKGERQPRPVKRIARRAAPMSSAEFKKATKQQIRWNIDELEGRTTPGMLVSEGMIWDLLKLQKVAPGADPKEVHTFQRLVSMGVVTDPKIKQNGKRMFDRDTVVRELKAWAGVR